MHPAIPSAPSCTDTHLSPASSLASTAFWFSTYSAGRAFLAAASSAKNSFSPAFLAFFSARLK